ncbi:MULTISPECIES: AraC family transcriptional regulator [Pseudomonas]|uniref:AraC family transcriptional regulator n=1 Tax=Pseudomonas TaxID=286 RepID=UPI000DAA96D9|nr:MULTISPECIES: AraC family transcriptional regulator [Pseudomonas]MDW3713854.1 AraC family transcriptional regulator [Pseudomonas sp. 2023EL-01195]PZE09939.1 AraC family transcriptional regulator [Pseudomonas sp. 57B-090624]
MQDISHWPPRRSAISVQLLTQFGLDHGLAVERCLAGTGLDWNALADPGAEVDSQQELALVRNIVQALGHIPGIGLKAGRRYHLSTYGIWGFALLSSPTYRSAAELGLRYLDLTYAFHTMRLEEHDDEAHLVLEGRGLPEDLRGFLLERDISGALSVQRDLNNADLPLQRVSLALPAPADATPYRELLGVTPGFGAQDNRIVFARALLDLPLPGANPQVAQQCEAQCKALLARRRVRVGLAGRIRDRLLSQPGLLPDMERIANELHMTSRTLRRRLDAEGTSFRQLQEEVRNALAEELLATDGIRLEEIAERLGYGELSNFIHAFKRWKGITPGQYRSQLQPRNALS